MCKRRHVLSDVSILLFAATCLILPARSARADTLSVVCDWDGTSVTYHFDLVGGSVRLSDWVGRQVNFSVRIGNETIGWKDGLNNYSLDRFSGILTNNVVDGRTFVVTKTATCKVSPKRIIE
jgi:hypothetical protein